MPPVILRKASEESAKNTLMVPTCFCPFNRWPESGAKAMRDEGKKHSTKLLGLFFIKKPLNCFDAVC